jgi:hypothetical protein
MRTPADAPGDSKAKRGWERRLHPRFEANADCTITLLEGGESPRSAVVRDFSKTGLRLCVDFALQPGDGVGVQISDDLFVGEVIYCEREGAWYVVGLVLARPISKAKLDLLIRDLALNRAR